MADRGAYRAKGCRDTLTRAERAVFDVLVEHSPITGPRIAEVLHSTPASIKALVWKLRSKGVGIVSDDIGPHSTGYRLDGLA